MGYKEDHILRKILPMGMLLFGFIWSTSAFSGEWHVSPIKLVFEKQTRTSSVTVKNDGNENLNLQLNAYEWTQDAQGKDLYRETPDIIFFPKIMILKGKEKRVVRVGIKMPAAKKEKTYRLFIEEIPKPQKSKGARVSIAIRFGVPIFIKPLQEEVKGAIQSAVLEKGVLDIDVKNQGNVHYIINSIHIKGHSSSNQEIFSRELSGWYLLSGVSRHYTTSIPKEDCANIANFEIEIIADRLKLGSKLDVNSAMCLP